MIQDVVIAINDKLRDCYAVENAIYHGLAGTVEVNDVRYPVTRGEDGKLIKICPDDRVDLKVFHKVVGEIRFTLDPDKQFRRKKPTYEMEARMRMTVILKADINLSSPSFNPINLGKKIPYNVEVEDYYLLTNTFNSVSPPLDQDTIVNREWKRIDYSKHKCKFFVFDVNYTIRAVTCDLDCGSFLLLEDDYKLLEDGSFILL